MVKKKKKIERICKNCKLFNPVTSECSILVMFEGQKHKLPVLPEDSCFFEDTFVAEYQAVRNDKIVTIKDSFSPIEDVMQVRWWEDKESKSVKIEYPEGFFGTEEKVDYSED